MMPSWQLPLETLPSWARLNGVELSGAIVQHVRGKGWGLVLEDSQIECSRGEKREENREVNREEKEKPETPTFIKVPKDLILSREGVEEYAKVDQNFRQLLELAGRQSTKGDILLYLFTHLAMSKRGGHPDSPAKGVTPTAWTEYIKFLPRSVPVPAMWSAPEKRLLRGTSLEKAVEVQYRRQTDEFDRLRDISSSLPFWNTFFWETSSVSLPDWMLADAWYRSRCLELPHSGHAMAPLVDIANHSSEANAWYDENTMGDVSLIKRPNKGALGGGTEVAISYGEKSAAEMLFSYGFIDPVSSCKELRVPLDIPEDDPLAKAKLLISGSKAPMVKVYQDDEGEFHWACPFLHLLVLNEEDGLEFKIQQEKEGQRELRLFWQGQDVTSRPDEFEALVADHPLRQLFQLRAVLMLEQQLEQQWERLSAGLLEEAVPPTDEDDTVRPERVEIAKTLKRHEAEILSGALASLRESKDKLVQDQQVVAYLGSRDSELPASSPSEEDDFS